MERLFFYLFDQWIGYGDRRQFVLIADILKPSLDSGQTAAKIETIKTLGAEVQDTGSKLYTGDFEDIISKHRLRFE
jgi:hypothetical protein